MKQLKILIDDGLMLAREKPTGIGWYTLSLKKELPALGVTVTDISYSDRFCRLPTPLKRLLYLAGSFKNCGRQDVDLIHYTNFYVPPRRHRRPVVATVHDLTAIHFPWTLPASYRYYSRLAIACAVKYADLLLVPSEAIKTEVFEYASGRLAQNKVKVVFQDIRSLFFTAAQTDVLRRHFLHVGVLEKRKNLELLVRAFGRFGEKYKEARLVLIGKGGYGFADIARAIAQTPNVIHHGYLPDEELLAMYRQAHALIMPSLYEGFGRPVVEAMAMHLPVIASDIPTNREVFQRHGKIHLFDPASEDDLIAQLKKLFTSPPAGVDYGNLDLYRTTEVARRHVEAYRQLT